MIHDEYFSPPVFRKIKIASIENLTSVPREKCDKRIIKVLRIILSLFDVMFILS